MLICPLLLSLYRCRRCLHALRALLERRRAERRLRDACIRTSERTLLGAAVCGWRECVRLAEAAREARVDAAAARTATAAVRAAYCRWSRALLLQRAVEEQVQAASRCLRRTTLRRWRAYSRGLRRIVERCEGVAARAAARRRQSSPPPRP